jgi:lyso-ornithine lipid O-acyltransferase
MSNPMVAVFRLVAILFWTLLLVGPYAGLVAVRCPLHRRLSRCYWRGVLRVAGMRTVVRGAPLAEGAGLLVANHVGYWDIAILGGLVDGYFVSKAEVAGWPGLGMLARLAQTVFIERKRGRTAVERDRLLERLRDGHRLILFPEGTSDDGNRVLPFKSSLMAVAERSVTGGTGDLPVQPVSVAYTRLDGLPLQRAFRPFFAWYGDMTLADHVFTALGVGELTVEVVFHPPVTIADFAGRKGLANHCHDVVNRGVALALAGRLPQSGIPLAEPVPAAAPDPLQTEELPAPQV